MSGQTATLEELKTEIAQLAAVVKDHKADPATIDVDALAEKVTGLVSRNLAAQQVERDLNRPMRKGEIIGLPGFQTRSKGLVQGGKFDGQRVDDLIFTHWLLEKAMNAKRDAVKPPSTDLKNAIGKALDTVTGGSGDEYVPTGMAAELWQDMFFQAKIGSAMPTVAMPTDPFDLPLGWATGAWRKGTQNTQITP